MELPTLTEVSTKLAGIAQIETRIRDLERENKDVREPIKNLVASVETVRLAVMALTAEGKDVLGKIKEHDSKFESITKSVTTPGWTTSSPTPAGNQAESDRRLSFMICEAGTVVTHLVRPCSSMNSIS